MAVDGHLNFDTSINSNGFNKGIAELQKSLESLKGAIDNLSTVISKATNIKFHADTSEVSSAVSEIESEVENIHDTEIQVNIDTDEANSKIQAIEQEIQSESISDIQVGADISNAEQELENLNNVEINNTDVQVNANIEGAEASIGEVEAQVESIDDNNVNVNVESDTSDIATAADDIDSLADASEETSQEISEDFNNASKKMQKSMNKGINGITNCLSGLKSSLLKIGSLIGVTFSVSALINFSKSAKEAYNVQLEGETKLETVLGKHLNATKEQIQATKDYASALQEVGVIGDEVQLAGLQELSTYVENADSLKTMSGVLNDMLAQQYGLNASAESAVTISTMLGKVLAGQTSALSRYGYTFDEAQEKLLKYGTEEQRVATLAEVVLNSVGGMNEALAQTPAGRMKQLENTMGDIKERFGEAVTRIEVLLLPALKQVANALQFIADKANEVAQALSDVFGTRSNKKVSTAGTGDIDTNTDLTDSTEALADEAEDTADSYEDIAKAAKDANKANNEDLATFDKLNVKAKDTADITEDSADDKAKAAAEKAVDEAANELGTGVTFDVEADTDEAESTLAKLIKNAKKSLESLFEPIKTSWENYGEKVVDSVKTKFTSIKNLITSISKTFGEVWENGTGEKIVGNILNIFTNINTTIANIADNFRSAWNSGVGLDIVQKLADMFNSVLEHINGISEKTSEWSKSVNFQPILTAFDNLLTPIQKIVDIAGTWAESVWDKVFLPLASWAIERGVPAALDAIGGFLDLVAAIGENVGIFLGAIWDGFFAKLANWAGDVIVGFLQGIGQFFKDISENETAVDVIIGIATALGMVAAAMALINAAQAIYNALMAVNPTAWIILGIIAAIAAIIVVIIEVITYWDTLKEIFVDGINYWKEKFNRF